MGDNQEELDKMITALSDSKKNSAVGKLYNGDSSEYIRQSVSAANQQLKSTASRGKINLNDLDAVQKATADYLQACAEAGKFPSVVDLAVYGFGISRQRLYKYLQTHEGASVDFINQVRDAISQILVDASLHNKANVIMSIFQLKNLHGYADKVEVTIPVDTERPEIDVDAIRKRYQEQQTD